MSSTGRTILIVVLALIALPLLWGVTMMGGGMGSGMMGWGAPGGNWSPWGGALGMIPMVLVIGVVGALVLLVSGAFSQSPPAPPPPPSGAAGARDILDARYARGEVTREQYQQMRDDLKA